jgi:hypothetical protein
MRIALVALAVLAIVLPTALVPGTASAHGNVYSVQQVLRVFRAEGIRLYRQAGDQPNPTSETFAGGPQKLGLSVTVSEPVRASASGSIFISTIGDGVPRFADRGNVETDWTWTRSTRVEGARIHAALRRLRYSAADAARPPLPTLTLRPGHWRIVGLSTTPLGTEVDCVDGSADATDLVAPPRAALSFTSDSADDGSATLRAQRVGRAALVFSCVGGPANAPTLEGSFPPAASARHVRCSAGSRIVPRLGLDVRLPDGWYAGTHRKSLWIGNRRRCAAGHRPAPNGIYLTLKDVLDLRALVRSVGGPRGAGSWSLDHHFELRPVRAAVLTLRDYGTYGDAFTIRGRMYSLGVRLGEQARTAKSIREVEAVLRGITRR